MSTPATPYVQPYLWNFRGRCEEAIELYRTVLGAEVDMLLRAKDAPEQPPGERAPGWEEKIMHASIRIGSSVVMLSDGCNSDSTFDGVSLSITVADEAEAARVFTGLSEGGQVTMPLGKTFWSPCFGMVVDRFGVAWMVTIPQ